MQPKKIVARRAIALASLAGLAFNCLCSAATVTLNTAGYYLTNVGTGTFATSGVELIYVNCSKSCWTDPTYEGIDPDSFMSMFSDSPYLKGILGQYVGPGHSFPYVFSTARSFNPCYPNPVQDECVSGYSNGKAIFTISNIGAILKDAAASWQSHYPALPLPIMQLVFPGDKTAVCPVGPPGGLGTGCNDCDTEPYGNVCGEWVGEHDAYILSSGKRVYYTVSVVDSIDPYADGSVYSSAHQLFSNLSHELIETITDPLLDRGWAAYGIMGTPEISDLCQGQMALRHIPPTLPEVRYLSGRLPPEYTYYIQKEWSNADNSCI